MPIESLNTRMFLSYVQEWWIELHMLSPLMSPVSVAEQRERLIEILDKPTEVDVPDLVADDVPAVEGVHPSEVKAERLRKRMMVETDPVKRHDIADEIRDLLRAVREPN